MWWSRSEKDLEWERVPYLDVGDIIEGDVSKPDSAKPRHQRHKRWPKAVCFDLL